MKTHINPGFRCFIRSLTAATLGLVALLTSPAANAASGNGGGTVSYNIPLEVVQGVVPLTFSYPLLVTAPSTITASTTNPVSVSFEPSVVSTPAGVTNAQALSYLSLSATTLTFTAPSQTVSVTVTVTIPAGIAGAFSYELQTSGWLASLGIADPGAFINVTATLPQGAPQLPVIEITQPVNGATYTFNPANGPLVIPYTIVGSTTDGSAVLTINGSVNGTDLGITPSGLGTANATATGNFSVTQPGTYTITAADSNVNGESSTSNTITVVEQSPPPSVINLGAAGGFTILTYNNSNNSDSAYQCGPIGVVKGNWAQSGGQETNLQEATTVYLSPSYTNSGPSVETTVFNGTLLNSAWTAAENESATLAALTPTETLGSINANNSNTTIGGSVVGTYVFDFTNISLNHPADLIIDAPAGSTVIVNISGSVQLNGASGSGSILIEGGISNSNVIYNFTGTGSVLHTAGGNNGSVIEGTILAPYGEVQLDPGEVEGEVIAQTFSTSSGTLVAPCQ